MEGPDLLDDVSAAGAEVVDVFALEQPAHREAIIVDRRALARLAGTKSPRGPVAVVRIPAERVESGRNLLVSVGVSDPGNVGTMIRTAASFGWGYAYMEGSADPWAPKTIRSGAGGQFQTPVSVLDSLDELADWVVVASVLGEGDPPEAVTERPVALLMGEEAHGLPQSIVEAASYRMTIPTPGPTESLNVAVAAGIAIYLLSKPAGEDGGGV